MEDEVEIYENCFCYVRKITEYSEPVVFTHKIGDDLVIKTTQPLIRMGMVVKTPKDALVGNKIKLSKQDDDAYGLILFTSNKFKRFIGIEGDSYYVTYIEFIDIRTRIDRNDNLQKPINQNNQMNQMYNVSSLIR
jgi:hypothetical protein